MRSSSDVIDAGPAARRARVGVPAAPAGGRIRDLLHGTGPVRVVAWLAIAALVGVPLVAVVSLAIGSGQVVILASEDVLVAAGNSAVSSVLGAVGAVVLGGALAIVLERTDVPGRAALRLLACSPLLMPPFVGAIAWIGVAGPASPVNRAWAEAFGAPLWSIYGGDGVVFLLIVHGYPVAMLIVGAALRRLPADLEQAARIAGASSLGAFAAVVVPLLRPALLSSGTLLAVSNLADFGIPSIVGLPERFTTLSTLVYRYLQSATVGDPLGAVATIGSVLLAVALAGLVADALIGRRRVELDAGASAPARTALGGWRLPIAAASWLVVAALTVLPIVALATQSLVPAAGVPLTWETVTLDNLVRAVTSEHALAGMRTSIMLAVLAAAICTVLGLVVGALVTRTRSRDNRALHAAAIVPQAIPGLVIAVAWLVIAPRIGLFDTPWIILVAYVTAFVGLVVQAVHAPLSATSTTAEEAARVAGAGPLRALVDVSWRMAAPAAIAGGVLVLLTAARELTLSALLLSPGAQTLGVAIFSLQQAGDYNAASALSLVVALVGLAGLGLAARTPQERS